MEWMLCSNTARSIYLILDIDLALLGSIKGLALLCDGEPIG